MTHQCGECRGRGGRWGYESPEDEFNGILMWFQCDLCDGDGEICRELTV